MHSVGLTLSDSSQNIHYDIYQILTQYRAVLVHRAKFACLCSELNKFRQSLSELGITNHPLTPRENTAHRQVISLIKQMQINFQSYSEPNYIKTILSTHLEDVCDMFTKFRNSFNANIRILGFSQSDPCPINRYQMNIDDNADCQDLLQIISRISEDSDDVHEFDRVKAEVNKRIADYHHEEEKMKAIENERRRVLSAQEIQEQLSSFKKWGVELKDFTMQKKIGTGGFGDVFYGCQNNTGRIVAIKKLNVIQLTYQDLEMFKREVDIFSRLNHFAILPFVGASLKSPYCIITEFMPNGNLFDRLHRDHPPLTATKLTIIALGIASGMTYLHSLHLLHRDLKSLNILLDANDFPKICDFGMSRFYKENDTTPLTGGIGTSQWMAPEVLAANSSEPYDEKADVYSFGIILWELLTRDVPFRGLKEIQVAMAVMNQDSRPVIPQNCPPRLNKLIRLCWDRDPKNRPSFKTILEYFENGDLSFPGTNRDEVSAYINQFHQVESTPETFIAETASEKSLASIIDEIKENKDKDLTQALAKLTAICNLPQWYEIIMKSKLVDELITLLKKCSSSQPAVTIVTILAGLFKHEPFLQKFISHKGSASLLEVFLKYGSTSMVSLIPCLSAVISKDKITLNADHFAKLAPFLVAGDISIRLEATQLISLIIDHKAYDTDSSLTVVVNNVTANTIREAMFDLLEASMKLFEKLMELPQPFTYITNSDSPETILELTKHSKHEVVQHSLKLLHRIFTKALPSARTISKFIKGLEKLTEDSSLQEQTLSILSTLVSSPETFKEIAVTQGAIKAFQHCYASQDMHVVSMALRLTFSFLSNNISFAAFSQLVPLIAKHLTSQPDEVPSLAAACLTAIAHNKGYKELISTGTAESISAFLSKALQSENRLTIPGLRLSGVISVTFPGALFLEKCNAIHNAKGLLKSNDSNVKRFALMNFASLSASYPISKDAIEAIPLFALMLSDEELSPYPLIAITNLTLNPEGSKIAAQHLPEILQMLSSKDPNDIKRAFLAVSRITAEKEAIESLTSDDVDKAIQATRPFWESENSRMAFDILDAIASLPNGKNAIKKSEFPQYVLQQLRSIEITHSLRPVFMRIISRVDIDLTQVQD